MGLLLHDLITASSRKYPEAEALRHRGESLTYSELSDHISYIANKLSAFGLLKNERVGIYLPKQFETVISFFATTMAGGVFVPINPALKPEQVQYILQDCNIRILVTSRNRLKLLKGIILGCRDLHTIILVDTETSEAESFHSINIEQWRSIKDKTHLNTSTETVPHGKNLTDKEVAAILYTSGSTGKPKGVILSHKNMVLGAKSVAQYLENNKDDRLLAVLPFSFDYGFSQLSTAFLTGACVVLMDHMLPGDVIKEIEKEHITGLAAVPPLWVQLAKYSWPEKTRNSLHYITNSGGTIPSDTLSFLRNELSNTKIYLMYGLTEAFRSTYLPPDEIDNRPGSIGKAIPNSEIMVVREDGVRCEPDEPGELVHCGPLVAMGYWNNQKKTKRRFKPAPGQEAGTSLSEIAVWSGDTVKMDADGYLYFIGRKDEMIKTSGYRVSPTEVEEVIYKTCAVNEVAVIGVPHSELGQAIVAVITTGNNELDTNKIIIHCKQNLPGFMIPAKIITKKLLDKTQNGKIDRKILHNELENTFTNKVPPDTPA